ncbi:MAG: NAD(P)/FAD-dependent oxidoreductase [Desulfobacteraceae bacterium]|nr:NAD(P)/FAD-dependent oxidoreductase [Desulfobacteraceae bacterium]
MDTYDDIVVGSGISGLTTALILGMNQRKVIIIEKSPEIGGSLSRFYKKGIPFDTGFHFTGGFSKDLILSDMLSVLSLNDDIQPEFIKYPDDYRFIFENQNKSFKFHTGFDQNMEDMLSYFPDEKKAILSYFSKVKNIRKNTKAMDIRSELAMTQSFDEDYISLKDMIDSLTENNTLKMLFSAFSMCHGTEPSQISFANHSRVVYSLYESIARVKNGGSAFITAFKKQLEKYRVDIQTNTYISSCEDIAKRKVGTFVLNNGLQLKAENCIFTIHPEDILKTFQEKNTSKAFADRIKSFEQSIGFFLVFIKLEKKDQKPFDPAVITFYPENDMEVMFNPDYQGDLPLVMVKNTETVKNEKVNIINAFELSHYNHVKQWTDSKTGRRNKEYEKYKQNKINRICERITNSFPEYKNCLNVIDSASMLTFRDYLNNPYGSAYGIKQKIGQFNLFGRVQYKNTYAAGQSAVLPGIIGAMVSGFTICRYILSKDIYTEFIKKRLSP